MKRKVLFIGSFICVVILAGCFPADPSMETQQIVSTPSESSFATPQATETVHAPGDLVDYVVQSGDTLPALASHFNISVQEILASNPNIPADVTTLPPGLPMRIPAYFLPLTGSSFQIIPDSEVINGPSAVIFDAEDEIRRRSGFLVNMTGYIDRRQRSAWEVIELVAMDYSIHPRLFLTLLEFQSHALTNPISEEDKLRYPLGYIDSLYQGLYRQLQWAAELLCDGYYGWRAGDLMEIHLIDGHLVRPNPWQNAGTVALQNFFAALYTLDEFEEVVGPDGFEQTYTSLWGDSEQFEVAIIPANLQQPEMVLPFLPGRIWDYSGGPHYSWGTCLPYGAVDFAPPAVESGCAESGEWIAAPVEGVVSRSENAKVILDLDGDGDERTGWVLFFFHVAEEDRVVEGTQLKIGDLIGHPSCEGGRATGTHVHVARRYNGEWIPAGGVLPFVLDGWVVDYGDEPYLGTMRKGSKVVEACTCTTSANRIQYDFPENP
jgi:LasA protease